MNCNMPKSYFKLPKYERDAIEQQYNEMLEREVGKNGADLQEIWIKLACILLRDRHGFSEEDLLIFIAGWNRIYRKNERIKTKAEQDAWLSEEMNKCFPKNGFPQCRIDRLKEKT